MAFVIETQGANCRASSEVVESGYGMVYENRKFQTLVAACQAGRNYIRPNISKLM